MDEDQLNQLYAEADAYAKFCRPPLHVFLVQHRGSIVAERGWWGYTAESYQPVFSVTKSFVSALIGLALGDGRLALSDTLAKWFPELPSGAKTAAITLEHLLTMTGGFAPLEGRFNPENPLTALLSRPLNDPPGIYFRYDNEALDLLIAVIERAVGEPAIQYAYRRLFTPLGIWTNVPKSQRSRLWKVDKQNRIKGGYGLNLTAREMAAFGQLYLQRGIWQGESLIPADYIDASTTAQASGGYPEGVRYGFLWWIATSGDHPAFFASGRGGQYIYVVPALELVVVTTSTAQNADGRPHRVMLSRLATRFVTDTE